MKYWPLSIFLSRYSGNLVSIFSCQVMAFTPLAKEAFKLTIIFAFPCILPGSRPGRHRAILIDCLFSFECIVFPNFEILWMMKKRKYTKAKATQQTPKIKREYFGISLPRNSVSWNQAGNWSKISKGKELKGEFPQHHLISVKSASMPVWSPEPQKSEWSWIQKIKENR